MARKRKRTRNMRYHGQPDMPEIGLRRVAGTGSFAVTATRDDVAAFEAQWPGANFPYKGFTAEFDANGDLIDLSGWASREGDYDGYGLSALIDDMRDYGFSKQRRTSNPSRGGGTTAQRAGAAWNSASLRRQREIIRRLGLDQWKYGHVTPNSDYATVQSAALDMGLYNELEAELLGTDFTPRRKRNTIRPKGEPAPLRPAFRGMSVREGKKAMASLRVGDEIELQVTGRKPAVYRMVEADGGTTGIARRGTEEIFVSHYDFSEGFARKHPKGRKRNPAHPFTVTMKYVPSDDPHAPRSKKDVVAIRDGKEYARWPWYYRSKPRMGSKHVTINGIRFKASWR